MEFLSIRLKTTKPTWLELYIVYLHNNTTQKNSFNPSLIKPSLTSIILSDFNGYSQLWNPLQPPDSCGDEILNWVLDINLHILNGGSAARTSCITGNNNTPDISLCGNNWSAKTSWRLAKPTGYFNRLPTDIEINHKIYHQPVTPRSSRWRSKAWYPLRDKRQSKRIGKKNKKAIGKKDKKAMKGG